MLLNHCNWPTFHLLDSLWIEFNFYFLFSGKSSPRIIRKGLKLEIREVFDNQLYSVWVETFVKHNDYHHSFCCKDLLFR